MIKNLILEIESLEKKILSTLCSMDLEKLLLDSIEKDHYSRKINDEFEIDIYFSNETFSHTIRFQKLNSITPISFEIEYLLEFEDIKEKIILHIKTSKLEEFIVILKLNYDFSLWDIQYLVK